MKSSFFSPFWRGKAGDGHRLKGFLLRQHKPELLYRPVGFCGMHGVHMGFFRDVLCFPTRVEGSRQSQVEQLLIRKLQTADLGQFMANSPIPDLIPRWIHLPLLSLPTSSFFTPLYFPNAIYLIPCPSLFTLFFLCNIFSDGAAPQEGFLWLSSELCPGLVFGISGVAFSSCLGRSSLFLLLFKNNINPNVLCKFDPL